MFAAKKLVFSVTFFTFIFLKSNFWSTQNVKLRSPNFHFLKPYVKILNIALSINFWMLIFLYSVYPTHLPITHSFLFTLAVTGEPKSDWSIFFIFKNFGFQLWGIFRLWQPLARFVWLCAFANFALLRKHLVRFFSNII